MHAEEEDGDGDAELVVVLLVLLGYVFELFVDVAVVVGFVLVPFVVFVVDAVGTVVVDIEVLELVARDEVDTARRRRSDISPRLGVTEARARLSTGTHMAVPTRDTDRLDGLAGEYDAWGGEDAHPVGCNGRASGGGTKADAWAAVR